MIKDIKQQLMDDQIKKSWSSSWDTLLNFTKAENLSSKIVQTLNIESNK